MTQRTENPHDSAFVPAVADELEHLSLEEIAKCNRHGNQARALDLPCGDGHHSLAMAELGAQVLAIDNEAYGKQVRARALGASLRDLLVFQSGSLPQPGALGDKAYDVIFCHHGLHTLPYKDAKTAVKQLLKHLKIGGKLFLSTYGLYSELGDTYADREETILSRFGPLDAAVAQKYNLPGPVCLYSERDLFLLILESGGGVLRTFTTTYGSVKGVAVRI
ncbi:MAG: hypothetical protein RIR00_398 [Pseudomonadota bacterium]|jgi:2-polyprenyl-3-methyl-5-hydroxy-6-metoxy-1,4-benzoquinol methylase